MSERIRTEHDSLGTWELPADCLHGIHTARAVTNFPLARRPVHPALIHAYGDVKLAATTINEQLGIWGDHPDVPDAIRGACNECAQGDLDAAIVVDALQGGAGTSLNMNINEVLANRALQRLGHAPGAYSIISPLDDINKHQSTNDTFPTALKIAAIRGLHDLEAAVVALQEAFQEKEKEFAHIVKVGRTQFQDAVLTTLGREMSAYAEAVNRDRWRIYKCEERLRVINLGGTAIGTGFAAPREFIFRVTDALREQTGLPLARAENLIECTQNADVFVEVHGILKACAATLWKIASDLRLLSSGPEAGLGEIHLPAVQAGSSIMPGKVNPVIPEAVTQAAMQVFGNDQAVALACAAGSLELNAFLPLVADSLLTSIDLLTRACELFRTHCVTGITADETQCRAHVENGTALVTALLPVIGYDRAAEVAKRADAEGRSIREIVCAEKILSEADFDALLTAEAVCKLGI